MTDATAPRERLSDRIEAIRKRYPDDAVIQETTAELTRAMDDLSAVTAELTQRTEEVEGHEVELAKERERWRMLFDFAPDAMIVTNRFGAILEINRRAQELLHYEVPRHRRRMLGLMLDRSSRQAFQRILRDPERRGAVATTVTLDTADFHGELRCSAIDPDCLLWLLRDVSEAERSRELLEQAVKQEQSAAAELRAVEAMRRAFVLGVSHDLRSPIAGIAGLAQILRSHELSRDKQGELLEKVEDAAQRTMSLLSDLLDYEHIEQAATPAERRRIDVTKVVETSVESVTPDGRTVTLDLDQTAANADPRIVDRIVVNLVRNAVQHTPSGSAIWVRCRREPDGILLVVEDNGPGVPVELRKAVFGLFHRQEGGEQKGLGVGLAVVQRLAELHGGYARVEPRRGGGASFHVLLTE